MWSFDLLRVGRLNSIGSIITQNKILLVDDQQFNLNALEIILKYSLKVDVESVCVFALSG